MTNYRHGIHGNRGTTFSGAWLALSNAYGGNVKLAEAIGVEYNSLYRWVVKGHTVRPSIRKLVDILAAEKGLPSPFAAE